MLLLNKEIYPLTSKNRFRGENSFDVIAYYDKQINNPGDVIKACSTLRSIYNKPGVLSFEQIKSLMKIGILIYDGSEDNIQTASYDLTLQDEFLKSGVKIEKKILLLFLLLLL